MNDIDEIKEKFFEDNKLRLMPRKEKNKILILEVIMERLKNSEMYFQIER